MGVRDRCRDLRRGHESVKDVRAQCDFLKRVQGVENGLLLRGHFFTCVLIRKLTVRDGSSLCDRRNSRTDGLPSSSSSGTPFTESRRNCSTSESSPLPLSVSISSVRRI